MRTVLVVAVAALAGLVARCLGDTYVDRLPDHDGLYLVDADNSAPQPPLAAPDRTFVIVIDGLREDAARTMAATATLARHGQCRTTDVGDLTISRPVYAVISTGLEADRAGARNNDNRSPLTAESIWQVARAAGMRVTATSELRWWSELFPDGFDAYREVDPADDAFALAEPADLTLIHPVYVDDTAHDHGGASAAYREAVARVDRELSAFLADHVALGRDLVVLTADHGHTDRGGHGGPAPVVSRVLTCWAGAGIARAEGGAMDARTIAPALAVLLGIPFPRNMRAGEDDLDTLWEIADADTMGTDYAAARRHDIDQIRDANRRALAGWLGGDADDARWSSLYASRGRRNGIVFALVAALVMAMVVGSLVARKLGRRDAATTLVWIGALIVASAASYAALRGGLDLTSINRRALFIKVSVACSVSCGVVASAAHVALWRDLDRLSVDLATAAAAVAGVGIAHPIAYGWTMGFPLPGPTMMFLPFLAAALAAAFGGLAIVAAAIAWLRSRARRRPG